MLFLLYSLKQFSSLLIVQAQRSLKAAYDNEKDAKLTGIYKLIFILFL